MRIRKGVANMYVNTAIEYSERYYAGFDVMHTVLTVCHVVCVKLELMILTVVIHPIELDRESPKVRLLEGGNGMPHCRLSMYSC